MESVDELTSDCTELQSFLKSASRSNVRKLLASEITMLQKKIHQLQEDSVKKETTNGNTEKVSSKENQAVRVFTKKIESYGWDQNDKTVKIYVTLEGIEKVPKENIQLEVKLDSFEFKVSNMDGKNYSLSITKLLEEIDPALSSHKVKSGNVIILLKKKVANNWTALTDKEKKVIEEKTPKIDKDENPQAGIMKMMKQMYDDGDDEMKRTIAKAWTESRDKQATGENPLDF